MQLAVTKAIISSFEEPQPYESLLFQDWSLVDDGHQRTSRPFPYDVKFLSTHELDDLVRLAVEYEHEAWPMERIEAYRGKNLVAKRAAVTSFLWQRYTEYPQMSLKILKLWHETEQIEKMLKGPDWFRVQHTGEENVEELWDQELGEKRQEFEQRHQSLIAKIQTLLV